MENGQESQAKITQSKLCWYSWSRCQVGITALKYHGLAPGKASNCVLAAHIALPRELQTRDKKPALSPSEFGSGARALQAVPGQWSAPEV